jgi:surfactin synthase thioesterase subunit
MKITELTTEIIADYLRIDAPDDVQAREITMAKEAAVQFVKDYTGQDDDFVDESDTLTLAVLILTADFYENRQYQAAGGRSSEVNKAIESILAMHSIALV